MGSVHHPDKEHTIENFISRQFVCFNSWQCLDKDKGGNRLGCGVCGGEWRRRVRFKLPFLQDPSPH